MDVQRQLSGLIPFVLVASHQREAADVPPTHPPPTPLPPFPLPLFSRASDESEFPPVNDRLGAVSNNHELIHSLDPDSIHFMGLLVCRDAKQGGLNGATGPRCPGYQKLGGIAGGQLSVCGNQKSPCNGFWVRFSAMATGLLWAVCDILRQQCNRTTTTYYHYESIK